MSWWNMRHVGSPVAVVPPVKYDKMTAKEDAMLTINVHKDIPAGTVIPYNDPEKVLGSYVTPLPPIKKDPPPDLSTKPKDIVGYCFGYVCPKKHVQGTFENVTVDGFKERRACQTCGGVSKPAVVKRTAEPGWVNLAKPDVGNRNPEPKWGWYNSYNAYFGFTLGWGETLWTKHEFVRFLDEQPRTGTPKVSPYDLPGLKRNAPKARKK